MSTVESVFWNVHVYFVFGFHESLWGVCKPLSEENKQILCQVNELMSQYGLYTVCDKLKGLSNISQ